MRVQSLPRPANAQRRIEMIQQRHDGLLVNPNHLIRTEKKNLLLRQSRLFAQICFPDRPASRGEPGWEAGLGHRDPGALGSISRKDHTHMSANNPRPVIGINTDFYAATKTYTVRRAQRRRLRRRAAGGRAADPDSAARQGGGTRRHPRPRRWRALDGRARHRPAPARRPPWPRCSRWPNGGN